MVIQYPHILKYDIVTGGYEDVDENGDTIIVPGSKSTVEIKCRFEPNADGERIVSADGEQLEFGWIIYMPAGSPELSSGMQITGTLDDQVIAQGEVKRYSKGQLNARAWV